MQIIKEQLFNPDDIYINADDIYNYHLQIMDLNSIIKQSLKITNEELLIEIKLIEAMHSISPKLAQKYLESNIDNINAEYDTNFEQLRIK